MPAAKPQQPAQWNPEQLLDKNSCEIFCKVRKVHSGDQLRLQYAFPDRSQPSIDFLLILDYVISPRVSRNPNDTAEEAFGFEAREYLRKFLNGAVVRCTWNVDKGKKKNRGKQGSLGAALKELTPKATSAGGDVRLARVYGELKCLRENPKQRYSEALYRDENNWIDVAALMCQQGWAITKRIKEEERHPLWHRCKDAEDAARGGGRGQHQAMQSIRKHTRNLDWSPHYESLFEKFKHKPVQGIVEDVREGSTIRCEIFMPTDGSEISSQMLWVCLSGIQADRMPKPVKTQRMEHEERKRREATNKPFQVLKPTKLAQDAKVHVERRLLHQDVTITLQNYSKTENKVWGTITLGPHDIASYLLRQGLAWTEDWSMAQKNAQMYAQAEQMAQQQGKGRWAGKGSSKQKAQSKAEWVVTQVYNADCVWLSNETAREDGSKAEGKRAYLAHIKAPRENRQAGPGASDVYAWEAKEFVRKSLIGKPIKVKTIYRKQFAARANEKVAPMTEFVSITYDGNKDVAYELVKQGLAKVIRTNEMTRADNYFQLAEANEKARGEGLGVHGDDSKYREPKREDFTLPRMSNDQQRENKKREILTKSRKLMRRLGLGDNIDMGVREVGKRSQDTRSTSQAIPAVIEYVFGATRMKARIEVDGMIYLIILFLGGVRGQRGQDLNESQRKIQKTADDWVRGRVQQRGEVFVEIESLDKNSNFVGHILMGAGRGAQNLSLFLLNKGWVEIFAPAARRSKYGKTLTDAENTAKEEKLGMWENYVEVQETTLQEGNKGDPARSSGPRKHQKHKMEGKKNKAQVTYVESATELFVVFMGEDEYDRSYNTVTNYMRTVNPIVNPIQKGSEFKPGDLVAGLFSGAYYRCRISSIRNKDRIHNVRFIDFGNRGPLKEAEILPLERFNAGGVCTEGTNMKNIEALAKRCRLAGLKPPPEKAADYCNAAGTFFAQHAYGEVEIEILQVRRERKFEIYEVEVKKDGVNLNELMVQDGWCRVDDRAFSMWGGGRDKRECKYPDRLKTLRDLQKDALTKHHGMYQYGNVDSDDDGDM